MNTTLKSGPTVALTTVQLRELCDQAEALNFANGPNARFWETVDPNGIHVVTIWFVHRPNLPMWKGVDHNFDFTHGGGKNIRALLLCKMRGKKKPSRLPLRFRPRCVYGTSQIRLQSQGASVDRGSGWMSFSSRRAFSRPAEMAGLNPAS